MATHYQHLQKPQLSQHNCLHRWICLCSQCKLMYAFHLCTQRCKKTTVKTTTVLCMHAGTGVGHIWLYGAKDWSCRRMEGALMQPPLACCFCDWASLSHPAAHLFVAPGPLAAVQCLPVPAITKVISYHALVFFHRPPSSLVLYSSSCTCLLTVKLSWSQLSDQQFSGQFH